MRRTQKGLLNQLSPIPFNVHLQRIEIKIIHFQVCAHSPNFSVKDTFFTVKIPSLKLKWSKPFSTNQRLNCSHEKPISSSGSGCEIDKNHSHFTSIRYSSIVRSVILRCSYLWEKKGETIAEVSLQDILLKLSAISPELTRRFWRVSTLKPEDVLEILLGFEFNCGKPATEATKIKLLCKLFKWASDQSKDFEHLPRSYEIILSRLVRAGLLKEAEYLLRTMETRGVLLGDYEIFSVFIEGYVSAQELENSVSMYNWMRNHGLVPSELCYRLLLDLLIKMNKTQLAFQVYMDMVDVGLGLSNVEVPTFELLTRLLCKEGKIQKARNLVKKVTASGSEPSRVVLNAIADGYCEKKDWEDLLCFLNDRKCAPDAPICNKILLSQCRNLGTKKAALFMHELEYLGFRPDEITFGIFISWSCQEGNLKTAFLYLSELLSRHLQPDVHSFNTLIGGVFKEGMWKRVKDILDEMLERGIQPDLSTFRILLAGYCKFRQFDEAKAIIKEMVNCGLVQLSGLEDPLSKAFMVLGFDPSAIKVKRDNGAGFWKAEFFDNLGNGLYLETDLDDYEKTVMGVLENAIVPDFNHLVLKECDRGDIEAALMVKDDIVRRGQKLSLSAYSALVKSLCVSRYNIRKAIYLLEEMADQAYQLDHGTLNLLIRAISKKGIPHKGRIILEGMLKRNLPVDNETFTALIIGLCKKGSRKELQECWEVARKHKWLPISNYKVLMGCLCQQGMLKEMLEIIESVLETCAHLNYDICSLFLEELCGTGYTSVGHIFVEESLREGWFLDHLAYSHLIRGFCKEQRYHEVFGILDTMLERNMTLCVDVYSLLIPQLCRSCRLEKALVLKEIMLRNKPETHLSVYYALVNGLCKIRQVGQATLQFQEMIMKGVSPDTEICNIMIQGHCRDKNSRKVRELLGIMVRKNFSLLISSYGSLVSLMCMQGRELYVLGLKELMLRETKSTSLVIYNILIFHLLQTGNSALVTVLKDEMLRKALEFDEVSYNFLIYGYFTCKEVSRSVETLKAMIGKDLRPSNRSLRTVIRHLCSHRELNKALELSRVMELRGWMHDSVVQNAIVEGLLSYGRLQEAENFLNRMEDQCLIPDGIIYDNLIKWFCWYGRVNKAVDLLNIMLKKGSLPSPSSYDSVIQGFSNCKAFDEALNFHTEMLVRNFMPSIRSWDMLVHGLCTNGRTAESERLLDSMLQLGQTPTRNMYQSVIDRYCLDNNLKKASEILHKMQGNGYVPDFSTHWSLISNLSNSNKENSDSGGFLSKLLSWSGFTQKKDSKAKV